MAAKKTAVRTVSVMIAISLIGKVLGLVRDMLYSYNFGTDTMEGAAFAIAGSIPRNFLDAVFASVITASFIPIYKEAFEKDGRERADRLSDSFITLVIVFSGIVTVLLVVFSGGLADLLCGGYDEPTRALTAALLRIMFPMIVFSGAAFCMTGILHCMDEFNVPAAMSVASNVIIIIYYLFFLDKFGIKGVAWVFLAGWALQALIQAPFLIKHGYRFKPRFDSSDQYMKKIYRLILPVMIGTWAQPVNLTVNASMATYAGDGASAALYFSNSLFSIITGVFVLSVSNLALPELSRLSIGDDRRQFTDNLSSTLRVISFILIPMSAGLIILGKPVIRLVFEWGMFDAASTELTAGALSMYSLGMLGYGFQTILSRGFYALKDGKTPLYTSLIAIAVNAGAGYLLLGPMGVGGPALASSISITVVGIILFGIMSKRCKGLISADFLRDIVKMLCASFVMAMVVIGLVALVTNLIPNGLYAALVSAGLGAIVGIAVYMLLCKLIGIKEADVVFGFLGLFGKSADRSDF